MSMHEHGTYLGDCDVVVIFNDEVHFFQDVVVAGQFLISLENDEADYVGMYIKIGSSRKEDRRNENKKMG